jgi:hypothetical protein
MKMCARGERRESAHQENNDKKRKKCQTKVFQTYHIVNRKDPSPAFQLSPPPVFIPSIDNLDNISLQKKMNMLSINITDTQTAVAKAREKLIHTFSNANSPGSEGVKGWRAITLVTVDKFAAAATTTRGA